MQALNAAIVSKYAVPLLTVTRHGSFVIVIIIIIIIIII